MDALTLGEIHMIFSEFWTDPELQPKKSVYYYPSQLFSTIQKGLEEIKSITEYTLKKELDE